MIVLTESITSKCRSTAVFAVSAKPGSPDHYVTTARRIAAETPNSFYPDQYSNPNNPDAHYRTTGPEINPGRSLVSLTVDDSTITGVDHPLTLSGGDLTPPVAFDLVGPPSPRPDTIPVPPDPDNAPG